MAANPVTSDLALQLDARTITGLNDGDAISTWTKAAGTGSNATSVTTARPIYKTNIIGSNPVVRFAGGNDYMEGTHTGTFTGHTVLVLAANHANPGATNSGVYGGRHSGATSDAQGGTGTILITSTTASAIAAYFAGTAAIPNGFAAIPTTTPSVYGIVSETNAQRLVSGGRVIANTTTSHAISNHVSYLIGQRYLSSAISTTLGTPFDLAMLLVYSAALTNAQIKSVADWMYQEFGVETGAGGGGGSLFGGKGLIG